MWETIAYQITSAMIPQTPGCSRKVWFLDAIQVKDGIESTSNICNGTRDYCQKTLNTIRKETPCPAPSSPSASGN